MKSKLVQNWKKFSFTLGQGKALYSLPSHESIILRDGASVRPIKVENTQYKFSEHNLIRQSYTLRNLFIVDCTGQYMVVGNVWDIYYIGVMWNNTNGTLSNSINNNCQYIK